MGRQFLAFIAVLIMTAAASAAVAIAKPMSFTLWKGQQVVEAENQVTRLSNRLHMLRTGYYQMVDKSKRAAKKGDKASESLGNRQELKTAEDEIKTLDKQVEVAKEHLQFSKELKMDHYVAVYLGQFRDNADALKKAAENMSKGEVEQLLKTALTLSGENRNKVEDTAAPAGSLSNAIDSATR